MGIEVEYLSDPIPHGYKLYGIYIANPFGTIAEKVIANNFETIIKAFGSKNIIARLLRWEGAIDAEKKFNIKVTDRRPILVIIDKHPAEWTPEDYMIKIQLGKIKDEEEIKTFLDRFTRWLADENLGRIRWELRLQKLKKFTSHLPIIIGLIKP